LTPHLQFYTSDIYSDMQHIYLSQRAYGKYTITVSQ